MKRKNKSPNQYYLVLFTSLKQEASFAGLAPFKPLCGHRKTTKPLCCSPHPALWDIGYLIPNSKPAQQRTVSALTPYQQMDTVHLQQQLSRIDFGATTLLIEISHIQGIIWKGRPESSKAATQIWISNITPKCCDVASFHFGCKKEADRSTSHPFYSSTH